MLNIFCHQSKT